MHKRLFMSITITDSMETVILSMCLFGAACYKRGCWTKQEPPHVCLCYLPPRPWSPRGLRRFALLPTASERPFPRGHDGKMCCQAFENLAKSIFGEMGSFIHLSNLHQNPSTLITGKNDITVFSVPFRNHGC